VCGANHFFENRIEPLISEVGMDSNIKCNAVD
jgi:hypothetical protein